MYILKFQLFYIIVINVKRDTSEVLLIFSWKHLARNGKINSSKQSRVSDVWIRIGYKLVQTILFLYIFYYLFISDFLGPVITDFITASHASYAIIHLIRDLLI